MWTNTTGESGCDAKSVTFHAVYGDCFTTIEVPRKSKTSSACRDFHQLLFGLTSDYSAFKLIFTKQPRRSAIQVVQQGDDTKLVFFPNDKESMGLFLTNMDFLDGRPEWVSAASSKFGVSKREIAKNIALLTGGSIAAGGILAGSAALAIRLSDNKSSDREDARVYEGSGYREGPPRAAQYTQR